MGAVPVAADHGGPGDIFRDDVAYEIRLSYENLMAEKIGMVLERWASNHDHLETLRQNGLFAGEVLTWETKAQMMTEILL